MADYIKIDDDTLEETTKRRFSLRQLKDELQMINEELTNNTEQRTRLLSQKTELQNKINLVEG